MPITETVDDVILTIRLTPNAGRNQIGEVDADTTRRPYLKIRVSAPPVDGAANKALIKLLSKTLGLPKSAIQFKSGESTRLKRLTITGEASEIREKLRL